MNATYFPQEKVDSFNKQYQERMSAQDMDQSSNDILELQDNGEILEDEGAQQNDLENEMDKSEYTIKNLRMNPQKSSQMIPGIQT